MFDINHYLNSFGESLDQEIKEKKRKKITKFQEKSYQKIYVSSFRPLLTSLEP